MAFLEKFSEYERVIVISVPYRAALWISQTDGAGGSTAGLREAVALEDIIVKNARNRHASPLVQEVMADISTRRNDWAQWAGDPDDLFEECKKALDLLRKAGFSQDDIDAYSKAVMGLAAEVAGAFQEFDVRESFFTRAGTRLKISIDKLIGLTRGEKYASDDLLKVSYEEDVALNRLAEVLGVQTQEEIAYKEMAKK